MTEKRVPFSNLELSIATIVDYYNKTERAVREYFAHPGLEFTGYTNDELETERDGYLEELDRSTSLTILAAIEAHFRIDYLQRTYGKQRNELSRELRQLYQQKGKEASLSEDILGRWIQFTNQKAVISELRSALNYRHWLAHGRYWLPKFGRRYDFASVLTLAVDLQAALGLDLGA